MNKNKYKFSLTFDWKYNNTSITAYRTFLSNNKKNAWVQAKKWWNNCSRICGKNELGENTVSETLSIITE